MTLASNYPNATRALRDAVLAEVAHDEQMTIWTGEVLGALSVAGHMSEDMSYDDVIDAHLLVANEVRSIIGHVVDVLIEAGAAREREVRPVAKRTITTYVCDRCNVEMDNPVIGSERGPTRFQMSASADFGVAGGSVLNWQELCGPCNHHLENLIRVEKEAQEAARQDR